MWLLDNYKLMHILIKKIIFKNNGMDSDKLVNSLKSKQPTAETMRSHFISFKVMKYQVNRQPILAGKSCLRKGRILLNNVH